LTQDQKPEDTEEKEPIKVAFSLPQIAGGALAAMTAAAIGSRLGVAGTMIGAAVASIIGGIAATLYSAGIDRTHRKVSDAIYRGYERVRAGAVEDGDAASPTLPGLGDDEAARQDDETRLDLEPVAGGRDRGRIWKVMGLSVAGMFAIALVVITVVELGIGRTLDGRDGTTIAQVVREPKSTPTPTPKPSPSVTATPTVTPSPSVSELPTTPAPTASQPTATPVPSQTVTVTTEPTPATTP
jgi:hypothetical protein